MNQYNEALQSFLQGYKNQLPSNLSPRNLFRAFTNKVISILKAYNLKVHFTSFLCAMQFGPPSDSNKVINAAHINCTNVFPTNANRTNEYASALETKTCNSHESRVPLWTVGGSRVHLAWFKSKTITVSIQIYFMLVLTVQYWN